MAPLHWSKDDDQQKRILRTRSQSEGGLKGKHKEQYEGRLKDEGFRHGTTDCL
jgi:hypothetical protein